MPCMWQRGTWTFFYVTSCHTSVIWLSVESRDPHMFMSPSKLNKKELMCIVSFHQAVDYPLFYSWNKDLSN
jgi:hypothetical protein